MQSMINYHRPVQPVAPLGVQDVLLLCEVASISEIHLEQSMQRPACSYISVADGSLLMSETAGDV